eukprot:CAMPEP_0178922430 /NCGR_PEP_ID=MMETSP0786-20121207/16149_1 /TAXON_ID=186022 /ORGANISM="Thalassionema frauenfeldii, Strain CCMP 1798" /LENGTH=685 /DNA_ID=CAMNT_0020596793 /DNA_START=41 /DNA_END=2098 /DNA_ORIENTATION=-
MVKGEAAPKENSIVKQSKYSYSRWLGLVLLLGILAFSQIGQERGSLNDVGKIKTTQVPEKQCGAFCDARKNQLGKHYGGDLLDTNYLIDAVEKELENLHNRLKKDYGEEAFQSMWVNKRTNKVLGNRALYSADQQTDISYNKFKRKLQMKVLRVQIALMDEMENLEGCNCLESSGTSSERRRRLNEEKTIVLPKVKTFMERFVWSTGGHSAAAAHGNLHNESYTAFLEKSAKDSFRAVGIEFIGRNYAMGGMDSAPNLAVCNEAVYGTDADVISWDFGMTDGGAHWKTRLYASRTGVHVNRPAHVTINVGGRNFKHRIGSLAQAEADGVPSLYLKPDIQEKISSGIPDSFGMGLEDLNKLGPFARYYKCKTQIEKEEPCGKQKYNENVCKNRKFKASWHPGWREHASAGNILALATVETLIEALKDIVKHHAGVGPMELYNQLKAEEDAEYSEYMKSEVSDEYPNFVSEELVKEGLKTNIFFRNKAICKTSLLPAQSRYLGILTESEMKGEIRGYDIGFDSEEAMKVPPIDAKDKGSLTLVYEKKKRQQCEVDLNIDYKDYFFASDKYGWATMRFPNDAEIKAYASDGFKPSGVIMLCLLKCDWGKCPPGDASYDGFKEGKWKMELNGNPVTDIAKVDQCFVLKTKDGFKNMPREEDGRYELRVLMEKQADVPVSFIRITSIAVF